VSKSFKFINVDTPGKLVSSDCYDKAECICIFATVFTLDEAIAAT